ESSLNPKLARAIAKQTGARADYTLYGDTLGPAGSGGATYLDMELANFRSEAPLTPKPPRAIAKQTGARADYTLYGDTLGPAGSSGDTYLHMELANADAMVKGFPGGTAGCTG